MAQESLLWTALPNGYSPDRRSLRVSLLLSPRLQPDFDPHLSAFPDFVDWPATLVNAQISLHFGARSVVVGVDADLDDTLGFAESTVWRALFPDPAKTFVDGFKFRDLSTHSVLSYPAADMHEMVRDLYSRLAANAGDNLPNAATILADPSWRGLVDIINRTDQNDAFTDYKRGVRNPGNQFKAFKNNAFDGAERAQQLARFQLFHTPPSRPRIDRYHPPRDEAQARAQWLGYERTKLPAPNEFKDIIDFHQIVAAMNQYPTLLRRLGLVIDVVVPSGAFTPAADALLWADVQLGEGFPTVERLRDASPRTHAMLDNVRFQAVTRPTPQPGDFGTINGLLNIDAKTFALLQTDIDGAVLKTMNFARTLARMNNETAGVVATQDNKIDPVSKQPRETGAPALRNAGLMLVHNNRAGMLKNNFARQRAANTSMEQLQNGAVTTPPEMYGEDLVRGYRIDIWDDVSGCWHSLCRRVATYDLSNGAAVVAVKEEEGTVRLAATTSPDPTSNPDLIWLHEALVSWAGWSLCAPPPGRTIGHDSATHTDPVTDPNQTIPDGLPLRSEFHAVRGSLPRLRYGRKYWIRARVVDLAANSLAPETTDFGPENQKKNATAYFRYDPILAPAIALVRNENGVIETPAEGESMERIAIRTFNDVPALNTIPSAQRARRFAVANRTTQRDAELHGVLDKAGAVDPSFFAMLAAKDDSLGEEKILTAGPLADVPPVETTYAVMNDGDALPYLPDPLAVEVAARLFNHPTFSPDEIITIPMYADSEWPDALPFKIEIYEDPADAPHFDAPKRTLFVPLPKAARVAVRLSAKASAHSLRVLGIWNWLTAAQRAAAETRAHNGQHWMLTPWRHVEVVHATQRPLLTPEFNKLELARSLFATNAQPMFEAQCSIKSTDHLDLRAAWNEPFEDVGADLRENRARTDHAFAIKITDPKAYAGATEFLLIDDDLIRAGGFDNRLAPRVHEFNDTRYRRIEYWLDATTKFREFMPRSILTDGKKSIDDHIKVTGTKLRTWVKSSAPPPAPDVLYVVPTFGWVRSDDGNTKSSWRRGGGLRVYLNGPWNISGYGEMLGVVLPPAGFKQDPATNPPKNPLKNFVTQWGNDPIWLSSFVSGLAPQRENLPLARNAPDAEGKWLPSFAPLTEADQPPGAFAVTGRQIPDLPGVMVEVAPHDVFFDEEQKLWYCDVEITWGTSYYPFVRLALARYQPASLEGAHLSHIVLADFMPLLPDRWLNVTQTREPRTRHVRVFGHTHSDSSSHVEAMNAPAMSLRLADGTFVNLQAPQVAPSSVVDVWVERLDPSLGEDFGWRRENDAIIQPAGGVSPKLPHVAEPPLHQEFRAKELLHQREFAALLDERLIDKIFITPTLWDGDVTLPEAKAGIHYRLAIAEYEEYLIDDERPYDAIPTKKDRRLVFLEYVELT